jgi:hypothetical protein
MRPSVVAAWVIVVAGCSGADPGPLTLGHGTWGGANGGTTGDTDASTTTTDDAGGDAAASNAHDGGTTGPVDASNDTAMVAPPDAAQTNAFTGAPAYANTAPALQAQIQHNFTLVGRNCADCHGGASPSSGTRFDFAGRVFGDANGTTAAAGVEVRVVDHANVASSAYSDSSGYFWHRAATDLTIPAVAGVRNGGATKLMIGSLNDPTKRGGCNGCHDGSTTAYLHVP